MGNKAKKQRDRKARVKKKLEKRREKLRVQRGLEDRQKDKNAKGETIKLTESAPMPPRNGPCPLHPEYKFKNCPHGCVATFQNHRNRTAGDIKVVHVENDDDRKGKVGKEIEPGVNAVNELTQNMGDNF